jgi:ribosomal protein L11 methyltransferase
VETSGVITIVSGPPRLSGVTRRAPRFVWRKLASAKWADAWVERLRGLDPSRLAIIQMAGAKGLRLEYYCQNQAEAKNLRARFGGAIRPLRPESWTSGTVAAHVKPLRFGAALIVTGRDEELEALRKSFPDRAVLCIPAALAFGSGEHATTSMCLRFIVECAARRAGTRWEMLDLGTGSGVLALAARALRARTSRGFDYDPPCVRTARENARRNGITHATFTAADALEWTPLRRWDLITANLFMNVLVEILPKLRRALSPGGDLILSGLLADQTAEVLRCAESAGLALVASRRRGRWRALHFRQRAKRVAKRRATR